MYIYYGHFDNNGSYRGFYTPEIHGKLVPIYNTEPIETTKEDGETIVVRPGTVQVGEEWDLSNIPTPNIELTEQEWREAMTGDYKAIDGKHTYAPPPGPTAEEQIEQQLAILDSEYRSQFQELQLAWAAASMDDNVDLATMIQEDYLELKSEYQTKREAIFNGY